MVSTLGGILIVCQLIPFHLNIQFDITYNHYLATSIIDMVRDCCVYVDVWDRVTILAFVWAFPCPPSPCVLFKHGICDFVVS